MGTKVLFVTCFLCELSVIAIAVMMRRPVDVPFQKNYVPSWANDHMKYINGGAEIQLLLDKYSGTGFQSKGSYLFGHFSMRIKMVGGDSAGVVTAFYLSSQNLEHDEIDFEFLGNRTGQPYILQTNVYAGGKGEREQRIYLWFDPSKDYHTYSTLWNMHQIVFFVDDVPIRIFKNCNDLGVRYPFSQTMKIYSSLWDADDWATREDWRKLIGRKHPSSHRTLPSMWTAVMPRLGNQQWYVVYVVECGGIRRHSKIWTASNTGDFSGSGRSTPFTTMY
ncbi:hypothetical protein L1049_007442 [Liquidambar formosana]|uniref:GH16 domain-containing protein n=1 Tax=Liquidambar formosana TaxID=63359 RepID=A0AAP0N6E8_LIQFO